MTTEANARVKAAVEYGPLAAFFITFLLFDLIVATGALMATTTVAVAAGYAVERRIAIVPLITGVAVLVFGGFTIALQDEAFIKMKPTIVQGLIAAVLLGGLAFRRALLKRTLNTSPWASTDGSGAHSRLHCFMSSSIWRTLGMPQGMELPDPRMTRSLGLL